ncbi:MAG: dihydrolipoamide acetyltransferase family protein [Eubacteriaceae bacterium]
MANIVNMPQIGLNETSNLISSWNKNVGDKVNVGDKLFSLETDKSSMEVESEYEGVLLKRLYDEGDACEVLNPVCIIGENGEDLSGIITEENIEKYEDSNEEETTEKKEVQQLSVDTSINNNEEGIIKISPRAKRLAQDKGIEFSYAKGTGPDGRIIERDIYNLLENGPQTTKAAQKELQNNDIDSIIATGLGGRITTEDINRKESNNYSENLIDDYKIENFSNIRKIISNNMMQSLQNSAQLTLNASFDASNIMKYREFVKSSANELGIANITLNDIVMYAVAKTVENFESLNAHMMGDDQIKMFSSVHLGFACDTDKGLMVPTIFNANKVSLNEMAIASKELASQCQKGNVDPSKLQGATFTVSNLGTYGIENFTPVLNPPQTGILGVGAIEYKIKKIDGKFIEYPAMYISLTFDHRAVDGAPAAKFIKKLKNNLENFYLLLAK